MESSLSLEESNKLRIQLGLKPLTADSDDEAAGEESSDPLARQEDKANENYRQRKEEARRTREEQEIRERIAKAQNRRELAKKLRGPTLGEADEAEPAPLGAPSGSGSKDTLKWLKQSQKRAKQIAAQRLKEQEEQDKAALEQYDTADLAGLRVAHDLDDIGLAAGGEGRILTLRDGRILDGEEDELMDAAISQQERDRANAERKRGAKAYTGIDDEEFDNAPGSKRSVLSKYDAALGPDDVPPKSGDGGFRIGAEPLESRRAREEEQKAEAARMLNRTMLSLDYKKNGEVSDYLQEGDVGFKRPKAKKKKRAATRVKLEDDDDGAAAASAGPSAVAQEDADMADVKQEPVAPRVPRQLTTENFVDDDELAASLAKARRSKAKRTLNKMTPEQIAKNLAAQREAEAAEQNGEAEQPASADAANGDSKEGLTFDDTSEFVRTIQTRDSSPGTSARRAAAAAASSSRRLADAERERREGSGGAIPRIKSEPLDGDEAQAARNGEPRLRVKQEEGEAGEEVHEDGELSDEEMAYLDDLPAPKAKDADGVEIGAPDGLVSSGMAATLALLRNSGMIEEVTPEQREREAKQKQYDAWLELRRREDRMRQAERDASKAQGSSKDQATREYENRMREAEDARLALEKFKNYKPDIDIKYHDEHGRVLNKHEAWKNLSHVFHGKMPGKKKQELTLRRIEEERKREKMTAGDTPTGMSRAFADRAERTGQAHMVIGVGARNNAPQDLDLLGPNIAREPAGKGKGKAREGTADATAATKGAKAKPKSGTASRVAEYVDGLSSVMSLPRGGSAAPPGSDSPYAASPPPPSSPPPPPPPGAEPPAPAPPKPTMKPAFAPARAVPVAASSPASGASTPGMLGGEKLKLSFGKRAAPDDAGNASKRR